MQQGMSIKARPIYLSADCRRCWKCRGVPVGEHDEERKEVTEKGARRFDRFEQCLMRHLVDPESLYNRLQANVTPQPKEFGQVPE